MAESNLTRLAIVSDQPIYLRGMESLIISISGLQLIGEARSAEEAIQLCQLAQPEMILLDLRVDLEKRHEISRQISQKCPSIRLVLMLSPQEETVHQDGYDDLPLFYFPRDISEEEFKEALAHIQRGSFQREDALSFSGDPEENRADLPPASGQLSEQPSRSFQPRNEEVIARELVMAGKIQADILPEEPPIIPGWDIAARLEPARETSGDFYDFIPLTDHKWGVVVADVTDKGMGAALFMALSSTLIRTYASRFPTLPALTLRTVSERILSDTRGGMFVTSFFGVLEPLTGRFIYANAGHPPGYLIRPQRGKESIDRLRPTGMALGVTEQAQWRQKIARIAPGDLLVLYTDGITEAQNPGGKFFEEDHLLDVVLSNAHCSAARVLSALVNEVHGFVGPASRQDDIAIVVIRRQA
ncbi:MAG: SpoIIE family protein phosphatase [Anaerolineae bacterium]|nr:SpoIIE family protein phosphatase [Anaerolineae bacterium]